MMNVRLGFPQFKSPNTILLDGDRSLIHEYLHYLLYRFINPKACEDLDNLICSVAPDDCENCFLRDKCLARRLSELGISFKEHGIGHDSPEASERR